MKKRKRDRTRLAVWFCALMLGICLAALGRYLMPVLRPAETSGDVFGMLLVDIADQQTADSYHVQDCGVYVLAVQEESPADLAGVSSGDLLVCVNDSPIRSTGEFVSLQDGFAHGERVQMHFQRSAGENAYDVTLVWNEE